MGLLLNHFKHFEGAFLACVISRVQNKNLRDFLAFKKFKFFFYAFHGKVRNAVFALAFVTVTAFERAAAGKFPEGASVTRCINRSVEIRRRKLFRGARMCPSCCRQRNCSDSVKIINAVQFFCFITA